MIARALHALARGLDATADALEHAARPPDEHMARAQVTVVNNASSLQPRYEAQFTRCTSLAGVTPAPGVTLAVVDHDAAAGALLHHHPVRKTVDGPISDCECGALEWGANWSLHAAAVVFDALPTVQGRTDAPRPGWLLSEDDRPPSGWLRRPSLEDTDPELIETLRELGGRYGPLGVAIVASALTDPNVLVAHLRTRQRLRVVPQYADEPEGEKGTDEPDVVAMADEYATRTGSPRPGWLWVQAGQATEFLGRTVILPINRPDVPRGEQVLASARWAQDFDPIPNVVMVKLEGLELEYALARDDRLQVKTQ